MNTKTFFSLPITSALLALCVLFSACKKYLTIPAPVDQLNKDIVFENEGTAEAALLGIYHEMMNSSNQFTNGFASLYAGMYADELYNYTPGVGDEFVQDQLTLNSHPLLSAGLWTPAYKYIYTANVALEGLRHSTTLQEEVKARLMGECYFVRAFCYFYLVNFFGDVPLIDTTDYRLTASLPRTAATRIYQQITTDLQQAQQLLPSDYAHGEKTRPNKWAATALLARVDLYLKDYQQAAAEATAVLNSSTYSLCSDLTTVFLANSSEAIWQLQPVFPGYNTYEGYSVLPATPQETPKILLTSSLLQAFENGDLRKAAWVGERTYGGQEVYYPDKYKVYLGSPPTEYYMVLRLAEVYLVRAEALARTGDLSSALQDVNTLRQRAGLPPLVASDQPHLLQAIEQERRIELFSEWGHRFLDLRRNDRLATVLPATKNISWQQKDTLWPLPMDQLLANPALKQNPGY